MISVNSLDSGIHSSRDTNKLSRFSQQSKISNKTPDNKTGNSNKINLPNNSRHPILNINNLVSKFNYFCEALFDISMESQHAEIDPLLIVVGCLSVRIEKLLEGIQFELNVRKLKYKLEEICRILENLNNILHCIGQYLLFVQAKAVNVDFI
jgi:hypothetical protein